MQRALQRARSPRSAFLNKVAVIKRKIHGAKLHNIGPPISLIRQARYLVQLVCPLVVYQACSFESVALWSLSWSMYEVKTHAAHLARPLCSVVVPSAELWISCVGRFQIPSSLPNGSTKGVYGL